MTVEEIMQALADQIETRLSSIDELQVVGLLNPNPTPPSIDIYPASPFQEPLGFGKGNNAMFFTVRARVTTADNDAGQRLLLSLMDPEASTSLAQAVLYDDSLGGAVERVNVTGPSDYGAFRDAGNQGDLLGCTWNVEVLP